jgi:hypothetical protein
MGKRIAAIVVVGILAIGATAWITAPEEDKEMAALVEQNGRIFETAEHIKQLQTELIEKQLGDLDFRIYKQCHIDPPTTKEHQNLCARIENKLLKKQAEAKSYRW